MRSTEFPFDGRQSNFINNIVKSEAKRTNSEHVVHNLLKSFSNFIHV